ncbi:hypothetical protein NXS19_013194 [Fusarium pseudograminearum]|nr:hypothetical protein NXS19_013194 [Fusarium pseudograminearum]
MGNNISCTNKARLTSCQNNCQRSPRHFLVAFLDPEDKEELTSRPPRPSPLQQTVDPAWSRVLFGYPKVKHISNCYVADHPMFLPPTAMQPITFPNHSSKYEEVHPEGMRIVRIHLGSRNWIDQYHPKYS